MFKSHKQTHTQTQSKKVNFSKGHTEIDERLYNSLKKCLANVLERELE